MTNTRRISANGIDFVAIEAGDGPLVLLLHGFPDHHLSWAQMVETLAAQGFHAVAPAMRGFAPTGSGPDGCYQSWATGADAIALIDALGYEDAMVIGHDWGAAAAYAAARQAPERISKLVTLSVPFGPQLGAAFITNGDQQRRSWYMFYFQMPFAEAAIEFDDYAFIDRLWAEWSPGYVAPAQDRAALKQMFAVDGVLKSTLAYYRQTFSAVPDHPDWVDRQSQIAGLIAAPTLYLHGANDGCIGVEVSDGMESYFSAGLHKVVVPDSGHFLHLEQPDVVANHILTFIRS